ncbi:MAG: hypothetical protein HY318_19345 [Armatimonadetes bacterium]|nr:hypothetical protein [Armatimonadota bacterium]
MIRAKVPMVVALVLMWATAFNRAAEGRGFGEVPAGGFRSPEGDRRFTAEAGAKPLNNLVFQLLNVQSPGITEYIFRNPREGWVYICVPKPKRVAGRLPVALLDGKETALKSVGENLEAMRYMGEGPHTVGMAPGTGKVDRLEVRAMGELFYAAYGSNPHVSEIGDYTWDFLRRNCLDSYNSIIGDSTMTADGKSKQESEIKEWTDEGRRWYTLHPVPIAERGAGRTAETADEAYDYWTKTPGMSHPLMSGIFGDEFGPGWAKYYPAWIEALRRIHADPKFSGRKFYPYCPNRFWPIEENSDNGQNYKAMYPFVQTLVDCGYGLAPEWYLPEGWSRPGRIIVKTEDLQAELGPEWEQASRESFEKITPGASTNRVVALGLLSEPGWETADLFPNYDFNVWLDCQFQFLATDPAFFGLRGVQGYLSSYCGEEQTRLFAKLVRHYAIEGKTERMLKDPYVLAHVQNPNFEDGTAGWTMTPAVNTQGQTSIAAKTARGFGVLQGKYHGPEGAGDTALWMKRSAGSPNVVSQQIRNLVPGRLYSVRLLTGDYQELLGSKSDRRKHAISVKIENVGMVAEKCFQAILSAGYWYAFGSFNGNNPYWMNYHQQVFRAKEKTARLVLSDWASEHFAGGPEGEELIWNFIQVQPYIE